VSQIKLAQKWRNPLTDLRQSGTLYRKASGYEGSRNARRQARLSASLAR